MLFVDDLQWAASIELLHHLARNIGNRRMLILAGYRADELKENADLQGTLLAMNRERLCHFLLLGPLVQSDVAKLISNRLGSVAAHGLTEFVFQRTQGNPFFAEEMLRFLQERRVVVQTDVGWEVSELASVDIPESVKAVINERLERLGLGASELLRIASVVGRKFSLRVLKELMAAEEEMVVEALDRCEHAGVLLPQQELGEEMYSFAHDLTQDALYSSIGSARRRRLHRKAGAIIEKLYSDQISDWYEILAYHFSEGNDPAKALEYALKAGQRAWETSSWERATHYYGKALALSQALPDDRQREARVLELLSYSQSLLGHENFRHTQKAAELFTTLGDKRKAARMHQMLASAWNTGFAGFVDPQESMAHRKAAVKLMEGEPDSADKALAYAQLGFEHGRMLDFKRALDEQRKALEIAETIQDPSALSRCHTEMSVILAHRGRLTEAKELVQLGWEIALQGEDPWMKARTVVWPFMFWPWTNDRNWLALWLLRYLKDHPAARVERYYIPAHGLSGLLLALSGKPQEAREALAQAAERTDQQPTLHPYWNRFAGAAYAVLGNPQQAETLLAKALEASEKHCAPSYMLDASLYYGRFLLANGDSHHAQRVLSKHYSVARKTGSVLQELNMLPLLCEAYLREDQPKQAAASLERCRYLLATRESWGGVSGPFYLAQGMFATVRGHWSEAMKSFARARTTEQAHGFVFNEARVLFEWSQVFRKRDRGGDLTRGRELLCQALEVYERCDAKRDIEKTKAVLASLPAAGVETTR